MNGKRNIYIRNRPEVPIDFTISDFLKVYPIKLASFDVNICNGEHKKDVKQNGGANQRRQIS